MGRNSRCARLWISEMEINDTVAGVGTKIFPLRIGWQNSAKNLSQLPRALPRQLLLLVCAFLRLSSTVLGMNCSTFALKKR
jgi:hypothetical protein